MVLEKTCESPLDCKETQPVGLKETSPECSLEGLMLKLKLQYFGHLMQRTHLFEKTLILGKIAGGKGMKESFPRQVDKKTKGPQERQVWNSQGGRKENFFFPLTFLRII